MRLGGRDIWRQMRIDVTHPKLASMEDVQMQNKWVARRLLNMGNELNYYHLL